MLKFHDLTKTNEWLVEIKPLKNWINTIYKTRKRKQLREVLSGLLLLGSLKYLNLEALIFGMSLKSLYYFL